MKIATAIAKLNSDNQKRTQNGIKSHTVITDAEATRRGLLTESERAVVTAIVEASETLCSQHKTDANQLSVNVLTSKSPFSFRTQEDVVKARKNVRNLAKRTDVKSVGSSIQLTVVRLYKLDKSDPEDRKKRTLVGQGHSRCHFRDVCEGNYSFQFGVKRALGNAINPKGKEVIKSTAAASSTK